MPPKISFAMIVRNEETNLVRALESIKPLLDNGAELVCVDTGSIDRTVEIAKQYTDKVYIHPWQNDFSLHRNQSFSYATGDWIFQLDADEELVFGIEKPEKFLELVSQLKPEINATAFMMQDMRGGLVACHTDSVRMFRKGTVTYKRKIHNEPMYEGATGLIPQEICFMKHYGYDLTPYQMKKKGERTIPLLIKSIEEDPKDYDSLFYLANAYATWSFQIDTGLKYAQEYLSHKDELGVTFNQSVYYLICGMAEHKKDITLWHDTIVAGLNNQMNDMDLWWSMLRYGVSTKNPQDLMQGATNFIRCAESFPEDRKDRKLIGQKFYFTYNPEFIAKALYYIFLGNLETAMNALEKLELSLKFCSKAVNDEISEHITLDFKEFKIEDKRKVKLIPFKEKIGELRRNHTVGERR